MKKKIMKQKVNIMIIESFIFLFIINNINKNFYIIFMIL